MTREELLDLARQTVTKDRSTQYGEPEDSFAAIASYWTTYLSGRVAPIVLSSADVAAMMILLKVARLQADPMKVDSWCDCAGYAACGAEVATEGKTGGDRETAEKAADLVGRLEEIARIKRESLSRRQREHVIEGEEPASEVAGESVSSSAAQAVEMTRVAEEAELNKSEPVLYSEEAESFTPGMGNIPYLPSADPNAVHYRSSGPGAMTLCGILGVKTKTEKRSEVTCQTCQKVMSKDPKKYLEERAP